ncbi:hypothetical protein D018_0934A, partial [Vibrio parahaemolyticus VP2007-007]
MWTSNSACFTRQADTLTAR